MRKPSDQACQGCGRKLAKTYGLGDWCKACWLRYPYTIRDAYQLQVGGTLELITGEIIAFDRVGIDGSDVSPRDLAPGHRVLLWSTIGGVAVEVERGTE